jgi:hypothetical protein
MGLTYEIRKTSNLSIRGNIDKNMLVSITFKLLSDIKTCMFICQSDVLTKEIYTSYFISYLFYTLSTQNIEDYIEPV